MEEIKEIIEKIKDKIIKEFNPLVIIVFGSYARNTQNSESDIDIAIKAEGVTKEKLFRLTQELENIAGKDIDLVDLDLIENEGFRYDILMTGNVIYCTNEYKFDLYKIDKIRDYLELNEVRKPILDRIMKGDTIYGKSSSNSK